MASLRFASRLETTRAAVEKICFAHFVKTFAPIRRCDNSTAVGVQAL